MRDLWERFKDMQWVAVQDFGGPYKDYDFIAGVVVGSIATLMMDQKDLNQIFHVPTDAVPQVDLIAMSMNYEMQVQGTDVYEAMPVTDVKFRKVRHAEAP